MKYMVSGSHGFLGTNMVERIKQLGHTVVPIPTNTLYSFHKLEKLLIKQQPDVIIHMAAYGNQGKTGGQVEPDMMVAANIGCTLNLLEASLSVPYKAFLNFGSSSEYGEKTTSMSETDLPETDTFYGATKLGSTYLARAFAKQYNKPIVNIRPFSVYGDYEGDWRFIPIVIKNLLEGTTFSLEEDATHDWVYVKDFVNACLLVATKAKQVQGEWVNIGTGKSYTNKLIVEVLEILLNKQAKYKKVTGTRPGHSFYWEADARKIEDLGFKTTYDITEGLTQTVKFYKKKYL